MSEPPASGGDLFDEPDGATPLDPDERGGLRQTWITFRDELNQAEQKNVADGEAWARRRKRRDILTESFLRDMHLRMFGDVWNWAGTFRTTERNLGVDPAHIQVELRKAFDDARYWIEHATFPPDEIAVRLHHRIVAVHPFPNGNGRTARMLADTFAIRNGMAPFTWGRGRLDDPGAVRRRYIDALQAADAYDLKPLLAFARS